jgi:DNA-binding transcriptional regulator LsrR (DeoR family)
MAIATTPPASSATSRREGEPLSSETRLMLRAAQLYYRLNLTQDQVGTRLGVSRFKVGRLLDRALRESAVRIEIVHPDARLVELEDALARRFELRSAVVVDAPVTGSAADDELLARERVAAAGAAHLAALRPAGAIGVSWGRTMLELAAHLQPGWTQATEIVQLNGATSRSARPTRAHEIVERFGATTGAAIRLMPAPAIVGSPELRDALEDDPSVGETRAPPPPRSSAWASRDPTAFTWPRVTLPARISPRSPMPVRSATSWDASSRSTAASRSPRSTGAQSDCRWRISAQRP